MNTTMGKVAGCCGCLFLVGIVIVIMATVGSAASKSSSNPTSSPTQTVTSSITTQASLQATTKTTSTPTKVASAVTQPKATYQTFGDGTLTVGKDIQPGTYRTRVGSSGCYYARLSGFGGTTGEILSNDNTDALAVVTSLSKNLWK